jgi:hypothetical protein
MAEYAVVVRVTGVRFSPSALKRESDDRVRLLQNVNFGGYKNQDDFCDSPSALKRESDDRVRLILGDAI